METMYKKNHKTWQLEKAGVSHSSLLKSTLQLTMLWKTAYRPETYASTEDYSRKRPAGIWVRKQGQTSAHPIHSILCLKASLNKDDAV